jgi:hypothetical protein
MDILWKTSCFEGGGGSVLMWILFVGDGTMCLCVGCMTDVSETSFEDGDC